LAVNRTEKPIDPQEQLILFRIPQKILNNTLKHANAHCISLILDYQADTVRLCIADDGIGFITPTIGEFYRTDSGTGLRNIFF
jgi:signal transduction histidine kinase